MATGRGNQLTKQVGEYLVAAELCRRDLIAATFTGNVPHYDIVASNTKGHSVLIQVTAIKSSSWQFDIRYYADIVLKGKKQAFGGKRPQPVANLICVFVQLADYGKDKFFIFPWTKLQSILIREYRKHLAQHGGRRPKRFDSFHSMLTPGLVARYEGNWKLIEVRLK